MKAKKMTTKPISKQFRKKVRKIMESDMVTGNTVKQLSVICGMGMKNIP